MNEVQLKTQIKKTITIEPKCKAQVGNGGDQFHKTMGNIYISAKGYVYPCCWYGIQKHTTKLWKDSGIDKKYHNIKYYSMEEIINGPIFKWIEDNMHKIEVCQEKCVKENYEIHI